MLVRSLLLAAATVVLLPQLPVERIHFGVVPVVLGETSFHQVARRLGTATMARSGDAGDSRGQVCYRAPGVSGPFYYLEGDEMGGGERITQFEAIAPGAVTAAEDTILARDCHLLAIAPRVRTDRGIELGLTRSEVERRLRGRGRDSSGVTIHSGVEIRHATDYQAMAWGSVRLRYRAGRVVSFAALAGITD